MKDLQPGETVIKESGRSPMGWRKSMFDTVNGKLALTNRRLIFDTGKSGIFKERVELPLREITSVEKRSSIAIKVIADQEYIFNGTRHVKQWVDLINSAIRDAKTAPSHIPSQSAYQPPPPASTSPPPPVPQAAQSAQMYRFCTECGSILDSKDKFCGNCGMKP